MKHTMKQAMRMLLALLLVMTLLPMGAPAEDLLLGESDPVEKDDPAIPGIDEIEIDLEGPENGLIEPGPELGELETDLVGEDLVLDAAGSAAAGALEANDDDGFVIDDGVLVKYIGKGGDVVVPSTVSVIGQGAFYWWGAGGTNCRYTITSVTLPSSVTLIRANAFWDCSMTQIYIPDSVKIIEENAFRASRLTSIDIPSSIEYIPSGMLMNCSDLTSVFIADGVKRIENSAFEGCENLKTVTIPGSVEKIGDAILYNCTSLREVVVSDGVQQIGNQAFACCPMLTKVSLPLSLIDIGDGLFKECVRLQEATIPKNVTFLSAETFWGCTMLETVFAEGAIKIGNNAFRDCGMLLRVNSGNQNVWISDDVIEIGDSAFEGCAKLTQMIIGEGIQYIGRYAFHGCTRLQEIIVRGHGPIFNTYFSDVFGNVPNNLHFELNCDINIVPWVKENYPANCVIHHHTVEGTEIPPTTESVGWTGGRVCEWCGEEREPREEIPKLPSAVYLDQTGELILANGDTVQLNATLEPSDSASELIWTSDDESVATVSSEGKVKAVGVGKAVITVKTKNDKRATVTVWVIDPEPVEISITNGKTAELERGKKLQLTVELTPDDARQVLTWTSDNPEVATVSTKGVVKAVGIGKAVVTVQTDNEKTASITIKVIAPKPTKITITNGKTAKLKVGKKLQLKAELKPVDAQSKLTWTSDNPEVATVSKKGVVKAVSAGTAKVTAQTSNGKTASITIKVTAPKPTKITITNGKTAKLTVGKKLQLKAELAPVGAQSKLTWTSDNPKVATVSTKGVVKAKKVGKAKITVQTANGKKATITIAVIKKK